MGKEKLKRIVITLTVVLMILALLLLILVGIFSSCIPVFRTDNFNLPKVDWLNDYKRDIELVLEYEGEEYKMKATIDCKYISNRQLSLGAGNSRIDNERGYRTYWKSTITNNKLSLPGGEELEMINFFKYGEERFYSDEYVEEFKKKLEKFYDKKTGYYYNKINSEYRLEGFGILLKTSDLDFDENRKLKLKLRMKNYKISKRY